MKGNSSVCCLLLLLLDYEVPPQTLQKFGHVVEECLRAAHRIELGFDSWRHTNDLFVLRQFVDGVLLPLLLVRQ